MWSKFGLNVLKRFCTKPSRLILLITHSYSQVLKRSWYYNSSTLANGKLRQWSNYCVITQLLRAGEQNRHERQISLGSVHCRRFFSTVHTFVYFVGLFYGSAAHFWRNQPIYNMTLVSISWRHFHFTFAVGWRQHWCLYSRIIQFVTTAVRLQCNVSILCRSSS